eukprot:gnl/MRDRNA2_/MRDRNA2_30170_c0_seq1.p1 gnl/MRDRNA2_/MRDRNA2_30170_c0~~gnl/MRDRNA2_/MRDRNA2_30170_c0_seq1.p1  ORF type:complete len:1055 (-),score=193.52 gnl/MRDRNA2_/MRDRNA2_30170_c0_seq1:243-3407(-)
MAPRQATCVLRSSWLQVEESVAGLDLEPCSVGLLVEGVDTWPGQPGLRIRDAIVAIGNEVLVGLASGEMERRLAAGFFNGAALIVGSHEELLHMGMDDLREQIVLLLKDGCEKTPCNTQMPASANIGMCPDDADSEILFSEDCHSIMCEPPEENAKRWYGVRGRPGVLHGLYQFDIKLGCACLIRVGWAAINSRRALGLDARSFGFGGTGQKSNDGRFERYGEEFKDEAGVVISCLLDRRSQDDQTISFCINGCHLGVAFRLPPELADVPLFPSLCGKGKWSVSCHFQELIFPQPGYAELTNALAAGDAVAGPVGALKPPTGIEVRCGNRAEVQPGRRVVLHVLRGRWQGWFLCEVMSIDSLGCMLKHDVDGFEDKIFWAYLSGESNYRMELLPGSPLLWKGTLSYDAVEGAGLELVTCEQGYMVEHVELKPGQPNLALGDVIVAIGDSLLFGLEPAEIERCFGMSCSARAPIVVGSQRKLAQQTFGRVQSEAERLLELDSQVACEGDSTESHFEVMQNFSPFDADIGVKVLDNCTCAQGKLKSWLGVRGSAGILHGAYQYEIVLDNACLVRVGWGTATSNRVIGTDALSFGYGATGKKSTGGSFEAYGEEFQTLSGVTLSCLIDRRTAEHQTITYCLNGRSLGVAFDIPSELVEVPLFPAVCGKGNWEAICRCTDFVFPQAGYLPLAESIAAKDGVARSVAADDNCTKPVSECAHLAPTDLLEAAKAGPSSCADLDKLWPGRKVLLQVLHGSWHGQYVCEVQGVDELGLSVVHERDGFQETILWGLLHRNYHLEPLPCEDASQGDLQRLLWTSQLQVNNSEGAGLDLLPCKEGFLVQRIDSKPGQQFLEVGDVIVAIGDSLLLNLRPHEVERCFGESCQDGVFLVVGRHLELTKYCIAQVQEAALKIISECLGTSQSQRLLFSSIKDSDSDCQDSAGVHFKEGAHGDESQAQKHAQENGAEDGGQKQTHLDVQLLPVPGLEDVLLDALVFKKYGSKAWQWCDDTGAVHLEEILDFAEDFSDALGFKPLERKRFLKALNAHKTVVNAGAAALTA